VNVGVIEQFDDDLNAYFKSGKAKKQGIPSVGHFADAQHLSPNYFGDLVKRESGKSAQEYIHSKLIDMAKKKIFDPGKSISEIAYELGFKYPQHFTRLFKDKVGYTPNEFRQLN
jgi:AraC-like DNA-binding protein